MTSHNSFTDCFLTFCLQIYFQYNFFISLLFHLFFLILTCSCQYSYNLMLTSNCMYRPYIDTNNRQGMKLGRFKNRTPARFWYIYCTLFPLCHSNQDMYPFLKDASFLSCFCFVHTIAQVFQNFKIFTHLVPNFS